MPRRIIAALILLVAALVTGLALLLHRQGAEPTYKGRPLSYWLARTHAAETNEEDLQLAISRMGTNSLPFLLQWIRYEHPHWRDTLFGRAPESLQKFNINTAELNADASAVALAYLGTNAASALQELTMLARDTNATETANRAMSALAAIGPAGIQALLQIAQDPKNPSWRALFSIRYAPASHEFQPLRIAALVQLMGESNALAIRKTSLGMLANQVDIPDLALPPLIHCMTDPDSDMRLSALVSLRHFGAAASNALPLVTNALTDPSPFVRNVATNAIHDILNPPPSQYRDF
jgi:hypothetical protein